MVTKARGQYTDPKTIPLTANNRVLEFVQAPRIEIKPRIIANTLAAADGQHEKLKNFEALSNAQSPKTICNKCLNQLTLMDKLQTMQ